MKLYYSPGACSLAPHIALEELGLKYQAVKVDLRTKQYDGGDFTTINPLGYVPVLQLDDGEVLTEVQVILWYLADQKPGSGLIAAPGTMERVRMQELLNIISTEIHKGMSPLFSAERMVPGKECAEQIKTAFRARVEGRLDYVNERFKGPYLTGDDFTIADCYLFTVLRWTKFLGIDIGRWEKLDQYAGRVRERPSVKAAMTAEGLKL